MIKELIKGNSDFQKLLNIRGINKLPRTTQFIVK